MHGQLTTCCIISCSVISVPLETTMHPVFFIIIVNVNSLKCVYGELSFDCAIVYVCNLVEEFTLRCVYGG